MKVHNKRIFLLLILFISIGFAYLTRDLTLSGISSIFRNTWDVHFDNVVVSEGSVEAETPVIGNDLTSASFYAEFNTPGDFYEFTVDAVNGGTIDAMLNTFTSSELDESVANLLEYTVTYADGEELTQYQELNSGDCLTYKIRLYYKLDISEDDLPDSNIPVEITFTTDYIQADSNRIRRRAENTLYNVLKNEAESGGLAKKYTGAHQDSMDASKSTKDIYHWYADNNDEGTIIQNKNNVIFGNHCWQMIRTTDTGGTKLLYNGDVENAQCLNTRGNHDGFSRLYSGEYLSSYYWYGTDYIFDKETATFTVSGETIYEKWDDSTNKGLIGKFTCKKSNLEDTCTKIYYVYKVISHYYGDTIILTGDSHYSQFGIMAFNNFTLPSAAGYMINKEYTIDDKKLQDSSSVLSTFSLSTNYWYADSIEYGNLVANKYNLVNPYKITSTSDYTNLVGKYSFRNTNEDATSTIAYYIAGIYNNNMLAIVLQNGKNLDYYNSTYTYGETFTDNNDGTYTINNPTTFYKEDYSTKYNDLKEKYLCIDATNNTCTNLIYVTGSINTSYGYIKRSDEYKYAKDFTYDSNTNEYTLNHNQILLWNLYNSDDKSQLSNAHYTCLNTSGTCTTIYYAIQYDGDLEYIMLENGKSVEDALQDMLNSDRTNLSDSPMKLSLELWYKLFMRNYDNYIEDTIYCNDRSITNLGPFDSSGGELNSKLTFKSTTTGIDLNCNNITDRFSTANNKAKLNYKVGLPTSSEMALLNVFLARKTGKDYWLMSPNYFDNTYSVQMFSIYNNGQIGTHQINANMGVRPLISLKPNSFYISGDGSMETPYVVYTN